jgi:glutamyl-tRNA synthetase/nondiscriminating glutamyl-tRNA synthetase
VTAARAERVRFAPSPTGSLHVGNARTALFNWLVARQTNGTLILRIEDTDVEREAEGSEAGILEDLRWLGLGWDEGPDVGGPKGPYRQSERSAAYREAAQRLLDSGRAYRCFCTDEEIERERAEHRDEHGRARYSGRCRAVPKGESEARAAAGVSHAVRFRAVPERPDPRDASAAFDDRLHGRIDVAVVEIEDFVLLRRDGRPTYNFAVVVDDAAMGITLVLRGDDHLSNTPRQVLLYRALGHPLPEFAHLPMVRGPDGSRLSKRHGATSVAEYRARGYTPDGLANALALLGWSPQGDRPIVTRAEMLGEFDLGRVSSSAAIFDPAKLDWVQSQHIHRMEAGGLAEEVGRRLESAGLLPANARPRGDAWIVAVAEMLRTSLERFEQVPEKSRALFFRGIATATAETRAEIRDGRAALESLARVLDEGPLTPERWAAAKTRIRQETGLKGKALFHPVRLAVTGEASGPELDRLLPLVAEGSLLFPEAVPALAERIRRAIEIAG